MKPVLIIIVLLVMSPILINAIPLADACETPTSDRVLFKKYYICEGGWCLRSGRGK